MTEPVHVRYEHPTDNWDAELPAANIENVAGATEMNLPSESSQIVFDDDLQG